MAGRGSRLRPHSLTTPKPLISVAGSPIVNQLVYEIAKVVTEPITDIGFVLGDPTYFDEAVEDSLKSLATELGATPHIFRQLEPLGTGHAIMCAASILKGPTVIAYADTLIRADLSLDPLADAVIWVKKVKNPEAFGVVKLNSENSIINLVEKPKEFISDLAVIGIYYFKESEVLKAALEEVLKKVKKPGEEYQINEGILTMMQRGKTFKAGEVEAWMDCGNPEVTLQTNAKMLQFKMNEGEELVDPLAEIINSTIIPPCFIGRGAQIINSTVGPEVSIGEGTKIKNCEIKNALIQKNSNLINIKSDKAMIGNHVRYKGNPTFVSLGDYSEMY